MLRPTTSPRRRTAALLAVVLPLLGLSLVGAPAAQAAGALTLPASITTGGSAQTFTFDAISTPPGAVSGSAMLTLSGITNMTPATTHVTCNNAVVTLSGPAGGPLTGTCSLGMAAVGGGTKNVSGTIALDRGPQSARLVTGPLHLAVSYSYPAGPSNLGAGSYGGDIPVLTPPSVAMSVPPLTANGAPADLAYVVDNHSGADAPDTQVTVSLAGLTGLTPSTATLTAVGSDGTTTPVPLSSTGPGVITGTVGSPATLANGLTETRHLQLTLARTVHGGTLTVGTTLGQSASTLDTDSDAATVTNRPSVTTTLPTTLRIGAPALSFTQSVTNRSGADVSSARVDYTITAPAGATASQIDLATTSGSLAISGSGPFTAHGPTFALPDADAAVASAMTLGLAGTAPSGAYQLALAVVDAGTSSTLSATPGYTADVTGQDVPDAPTNVTLAPSNGVLTVAFDAGDTGSAPPVSHTVTVTPAAGGAAKTFTAALSPIRAFGLVNGASYAVTVTTTNALGAGPASGPVTGSPTTTAPGAPSILRIDAHDGTLDVVTAPPLDNGGSPILLYRATYYPVGSSDGARSVSSSSPTITLPGLTNDTTYEVIVTALNSVGAGPASTPKRGTPTLPGGVAGATGVRATLSADAAVLDAGKPVTLGGIVARADDPQGGMAVRVTFTGADKVSTVVGTTVTDALGTWTLTTTPPINGTYVAEVTSVTPTVSSPGVSLSVRSVLKGVRSKVKGRTVTFTGSHLPGLRTTSSVRAPRLLVQITDKKGKVKKTVASGYAKQLKSGVNPFSVTAKLKPGTYYLRVSVASTYRLLPTSSKLVKLTVK